MKVFIIMAFLTTLATAQASECVNDCFDIGLKSCREKSLAKLLTVRTKLDQLGQLRHPEMRTPLAQLVETLEETCQVEKKICLYSCAL
ncbi:MAG TPA: hypothetical protein VNJ01_18245 [Bacteriovoracaceae bacterium]|nr:hypothetical protein [Bacteriovoracaceae bacterium]